MLFIHGWCESGEAYEKYFHKDQGALYNENFKFVLPTAPYRRIEKDHDGTCPSWFDTYDTAPDANEKWYKNLAEFNDCEANVMSPRKPVHDHIIGAMTAIKGLLEQENKVLSDKFKEENSYHRIFVGGMSQGAALSLASLMRLDENIGHSLGGVLAFSGVIPIVPKDDKQYECGPFTEAPTPEGEQATIIRNTPLFLYNGIKDMTLPWMLSRESFKMLLPVYEGSDNLIIGAEHDMGHVITDTELQEAARFITGIVSGRAK